MNTTRAVSAMLLAAVTASLSSTSALALPILGLWNTGVDTGGSPNPVGVVDSHYVVSTGGVIDDAYTFSTVSAATPHWIANPTDARWIGPSLSTTDSSMLSDPLETYFYDLSFSLDPFTSAWITGYWASDNFGRLLLNGNEVASLGLMGFKTLNPFSITDSNLFVGGLNVLRFEVTNAPGLVPTGNPSGLLVSGLLGEYEPDTNLRLEDTVIGTDTTPTVPDGGSTALLLIAGLLGVVYVRGRRQS